MRRRFYLERRGFPGSISPLRNPPRNGIVYV
jgi:hypothetical protein